MIRKQTKAQLEQHRRLIDPDRERIRQVFASLPVPPERQGFIDGEVSAFCMRLRLAVANNNPFIARNWGSEGTIEQIETLERNLYGAITALNLGSDARAILRLTFDEASPKPETVDRAKAAPLVRLIETGLKAEGVNAGAEQIAWRIVCGLLHGPLALSLDALEKQLLAYSRAIPRAIALAKEMPKAAPQKGRNREALKEAVGDALEDVYRGLTATEPKRTVLQRAPDGSPGHPVKMTGYVALVTEMSEVLGIALSADNMSKGRNRQKRPPVKR